MSHPLDSLYEPIKPDEDSLEFLALSGEIEAFDDRHGYWGTLFLAGFTGVTKSRR
jgi:hypothetical protein